MKLAFFSVDLKLLKQDLVDKIDITISFFIILIAMFILGVSNLEASSRNMMFMIFLICKYIFYVYTFSLSLLQFDFLNDKGKNIFSEGLPFSRQLIFKTKYLSGIILVLIPYCLLMFLIFIFSLIFKVEIGFIFIKFLNSLVIAIFWYTFSSFFSTFTYSRKMQLSLFILTLASPTLIILSIIFLVEKFTYLNIPLYSLYLLFLTFLNANGSFIGVDSWIIDILVIILTALLFYVSMCLVKSHKAENVDSSYLPLKVKYIYIYLISTAIALVLLCIYTIVLNLENSTSTNISIFLNTALYMIIFILTSTIISRFFGIQSHTQSFINTRTSIVVISSILVSLFFNIYSTTNFYNYFDYYDDYVYKETSEFDDYYGDSISRSVNYMNPSVPFLYDGENFDDVYKESVLNYLYYIEDLYNLDDVNNRIEISTIFLKKPVGIPTEYTKEFLRCYILDVYKDEEYTNCGFSTYSLFEVNFVNDVDDSIEKINMALTIKPTYSNSINFLKEKLGNKDGTLPFDFQIITYKDISDEETKQTSLNSKIKYVTFGTYNYDYFNNPFSIDSVGSNNDFLDVLIDNNYISDLHVIDYQTDTKEAVEFIYNTKPFIVDDNYFTTELFFNKDVYRLIIKEDDVYSNYGVFLK